MQRNRTRHILTTVLALLLAVISPLGAAAESPPEPEPYMAAPLPKGPAAEAPAEGQTEAPSEVPPEAPTDNTGEVPAETPGDDAGELPAENPAEGPPELPAEGEGAVPAELPPEDGAELPEGTPPEDGAEPPEETPAPVYYLPAPPPPTPEPTWEELEERFAGKTWEEVTREFFDSRGADPESYGAVYYNTVTGEEHELNGDKLFYAASVYKLPLNMYLGEQIYLGNMTMDTVIGGMRYGDIQRASIESSNNELSEMLQLYLGSRQEYLEKTQPYLCPEDPEFLKTNLPNNFYSARYAVHALKMVYEDPEHYPDVLEHLKNASPGILFKRSETRFPIAHKYGYYYEQGFGALNDCAIVYTDEPIIIALMSAFMQGGEVASGDFCVLMCNYAQYWHGVHERGAEAERQAAEAEAARLRAETEAEAVPAFAPAAPATPAPTPTPAPIPAETPRTFPTPLFIISAAGALLAAIGGILMKKRPWKWILLTAAAVLAALAVLTACQSQPPAVPAETAPAETATSAPATEPPAPAAKTPAPTDEPAAAPTPAPEATPEPTPEVTPAPEYTVDLGGVEVRSSQTEAVLDGAVITPEELAEKLSELPELKKLDICELGYSNDESLALIERFPDIDFTWRVHFGRWAVRSDIVAFSSLQSPDAHHYTSEDFAPLFKYCTKLRALDVGHNYVSDLEPIGALTELRVLILADNSTITDISPLANLTNLEYLELFMPGQVQDYSALSKLVNLEDLNICYCHQFKDPMLLKDLTKLERIWAKGCGAAYADWNALKEVLPDTEIQLSLANLSSTSGTWRAHERNVAIRKVFGNWENVTGYNTWRDVSFREGAEIRETYPMTETG